jgi:hypothetical protein
MLVIAGNLRHCPAVTRTAKRKRTKREKKKIGPAQASLDASHADSERTSQLSP